MKILMVNKFLHPNGGSETYIFKLGDYLKSQGHKVEASGYICGRFNWNDVVDRTLELYRG